ncbi:hypothetical protein EDB85DRAFT_1884704 [Lactarius pseudohatsudake]|nr:hypothetical protein EDB85DRAFT_1884704 [Lactarius pseudohatsudake]
MALEGGRTRVPDENTKRSFERVSLEGIDKLLESAELTGRRDCAILFARSVSTDEAGSALGWSRTLCWEMNVIEERRFETRVIQNRVKRLERYCPQLGDSIYALGEDIPNIPTVVTGTEGNPWQFTRRCLSLLLLGRVQTSARENAASRVLQKNSWSPIPQAAVIGPKFRTMRVHKGASEESKAKTSDISNFEPTDAIVGCKLTPPTTSGGASGRIIVGRMSPAGIKKLSPHALDGLSNDESASITRRKDRVNAVCLVVDSRKGENDHIAKSSRPDPRGDDRLSSMPSTSRL